ncbi:hypothetical protein TPHA_0B01260 [Tetrapisispora phaffii CBS 4417]|uniref:SET domain-containing protein n=1 Tax=Tetrapisispora phaffii (strain ATCC 24235 / CBS 4417 / NBRC 1672 / NRRL Y-8282 / UCD 70-5) TaxID=1071381 RepID=G8BP68_TETPH|nr:hypothetical protein TPHA_0B01260 [Tetrapisispora phaffii CBS 4417]CCE61799.1 hypothetical protein TPHA_0B01260 [Tetrapisispora phaffii CBS 4417]
MNASSKYEVEGSGENISLMEDASVLLMLSKNVPKNDKQSVDDIKKTNASSDDNMKRVISNNESLIKGEVEVKRQKLDNGDELKENNEKKEKVWPVSDDYIVDPDAGVITCICGFDDDDGFSIQCDHCFRWQHAVCYGIYDNENVPEIYLCDVCEPRNVDKEKAKKIQLQRFTNQEVPVNETYEDEDTGKHDTINILTSENGYIRKHTKPEAVNNDNKEVQESDVESINMESKSNKEESNNSDENDGKDRSRNIKEHIRTPTRNTRSRNDAIQNQGRIQSNDINDQNADITDTTVQSKKKQEVFYLSAKSSYEAMYLPMKKFSVQNNYVTLFLEKHLNDDVVTEVENATDFKNMPIEVKSYVESSYLRTFPGFTKLGVYLNKDCEEGKLIHDITGDVNFKSNYIRDPGSYYRVWGTSKPKIFFHPTWPLYIDTRLSGNSTRYIRRSCNPNVEIATIKTLNNKTKDYEIKFMLKAKRDIEEDEELHLPWDWDKKHIIWKIINNSSNPTHILENLKDSDKYLLLNSIDTILRSCDCACGNNSKECFLLIIKKFQQSLIKAIRSKMSNRYKINEILNRYQGKRRRPPPILQRLQDENIINQEKSLYLLNEFNTQKLRFLEGQDASSTNLSSKLYNAKKGKNFLDSNDRSMDSISSMIEKDFNKPFKWKILHNKLDEQSRRKSTSKDIDSNLISNFTEYNETQITNLEDLPIIIDLKINQTKVNYIVESRKSVVNNNENISLIPGSSLAPDIELKAVSEAVNNYSAGNETDPLESLISATTQVKPSKKN